MLKSLRLSNFRKHADLQLDFESKDQLILISGRNGTGKSSILEGVLYALYGEGRLGKRNLDSLVRWGAEQEGLEVELTFEVDSTNYRVRRKRVKGFSTALLYGNDNPLVEGANEVTLAVEGILGQDSAGFKASVIAQQKELDGLSGMTGKKRAEMVSRLLRLDVITAAKNSAKGVFNTQNTTLKGLELGASGNAINSRINEIKKEYTTIYKILEEISKEKGSLLANMKKLESSVEIYNEVQKKIEKMKWSVLEINSTIETLANREILLNSSIKKVNSICSKDDEISIVKGIGELEKEIALSEERNKLFEQRVATLKLLEKNSTDKSELHSKISELRDAQNSLGNEEVLIMVRESVENKIRSINNEMSSIVSEVAGINAEVEQALQARKNLRDSKDSCISCGQLVDEKYKSENLSTVETKIKTLKRNLIKIELRKSKLTNVSEMTERELEEIANKHKLFNSLSDKILLYLNKLEEMEQREVIYTSQLLRLPEVGEDIEGLLYKRADYITKLQEVRENLRVQDENLNAQKEIELIAIELYRNRETSKELELSISNLTPTKEMEDAYRGYVSAKTRVTELEKLESDSMNDLKILEDRLKHAEETESRNELIQKHREELQRKASVAGGASVILNRVETEIANQIIPSIETTLMELLTIMSEGKFQEVKVDSEYNIAVKIDGEYRNLIELSGGEQDLLALAMRLSLANIVKDHAGTSPGFIILDECLGSQDQSRRNGIISGLRNLRNIYKQIFLISHIPGIEDSVDRIIESEYNDSESGLNKQKIERGIDG